MGLEFCPTEIPEVILIRTQIHRDSHGFFFEAYKRSEFAAHGIAETFVQLNHSRPSRSVLRGLHYQRQPRAQGKLARCVSGEMHDVVVDIRRGSPTYGRWSTCTLCAAQQTMLYVPAGFAHGFCVTSEEAEVIYMTTEEYAPAYEAGIVWNDADLAIPGPVAAPRLSERDRQWPRLRDAQSEFQFIAPVNSGST